jgi:hypothetical protein
VSTNSGIAFAAPLIPLSFKLHEVDDVSSISKLLAERPLPSYPPLRLSQILNIIENGSADAISVLEWLSVFKDSLDIDEPEECHRACLLLWKAISERERVSRIALFGAALFLVGQQAKFPQQLVDTLDIVQPLLTGIHLKRVRYLIAIRDRNFDHCLDMSQQVNTTPFDYHKHLSLPSAQFYRSEYISRILPFVARKNVQNQLPWLDSCLMQMTTHEKVGFTDQLLSEFKMLIAPLEPWLKDNCAPSSEDSLWFELESDSRGILKNYFKMSSYYSLQSLVDKLCDNTTSRSLGLTERDIRQLKSRSLFWSNYSERFNQTRLLVPYKTLALLSWINTLEGVEVLDLPNTDEEDSEVCIFDIGERILVEVLRGDASELRIFESTSRNKKRLLQDTDLTLRSIRQMACACVHDHVTLWQYFCEQTLRVQHGIVPNNGLTQFKGIATTHGKYSEKMGLSSPKDTIFSERLVQLEAWEKAFWAREARLKGHVANPNYGWRELEQAKIARILNNKEGYILHIKAAALSGNVEAMYLYGIHLINLPSNYAQDKLQGEELLAKAAQSGYLPALEIAKKFNIKLNVEQKPEKKIRSAELVRIRNRLINKDQFKEPFKGKEQLLSVPGTAPKEVTEETKNLATEIQYKIRHDGKRPYLNMRIDEIEELSRFYADSIGITKVILIELEFRKSTKRVTELIQVLKSRI